jgi:hypothetical protein
MADTKGSAFTSKTTPIGADSVSGTDSTGPSNARFTFANLHQLYVNASTTTPAAGFAADTYLAGSSITIPGGGPYVGTTYKLWFYVSKTAVGTATPIITLRIGTAGTTADTARCTFTFGAGTAAIDAGVFQVLAHFRAVGATTTAILQGTSFLTSNLTITGLSNAVKATTSTSAGFDSTVANSIIGCSYNGGASAVHTVTLVKAELML